jgi:WD40 repeat protein
MAISSDNHWLVTGGSDSVARLWDLTAKDPAANPVVLRGHGGSVDAVEISPDGHWLVTTGSFDNTARLWDLRAKDPAANPVVLRGHEGAVYAVAISPDNHWLATGGSDKTAQLWDLTAKDPAANPVVLRGHENAVYAVAISPNNHWLATGSLDNTARLWDLTAKEPEANPDRTGWKKWNHKWLDLTAKELEANPVVLRGHEGTVYAAAIGPDNHWLATGGSDNTARLWDLTAKELTAKHLDAISNVFIRVFHIKKDKFIEPDGRSEQDVFLEQLSKLIDLARAAAGRNLTTDEWNGYFAGEKYRKTFPDLPGPD